MVAQGSFFLEGEGDGGVSSVVSFSTVLINLHVLFVFMEATCYEWYESQGSNGPSLKSK